MYPQLGMDEGEDKPSQPTLSATNKASYAKE
jgi:hypothetical protein